MVVITSGLRWRLASLVATSTGTAPHLCVRAHTQSRFPEKWDYPAGMAQHSLGSSLQAPSESLPFPPFPIYYCMVSSLCLSGSRCCSLPPQLLPGCRRGCDQGQPTVGAVVQLYTLSGCKAKEEKQQFLMETHTLPGPFCPRSRPELLSPRTLVSIQVSHYVCRLHLHTKMNESDNSIAYQEVLRDVTFP